MEDNKERKVLRTFLLKKLKTIQLKGISQSLKLKNKEELNFIKKETDYLPKDCTIMERVYQIINNLYERPKCLNCNEKVNFINFNSGYSDFCSSFCFNHSTLHKETSSKIYKNKTQKEKEEWNKNRKNTMSNKTKEEWIIIKDKQKDTFLKKYGDENYKNTKKLKETWREKTYQQLVSGERLKNEYKPLFTKEEFNGVRFQKYKWVHLACGTEFEDDIDKGNFPRCPKCYKVYGSSLAEKEISEWLKSLIVIEENKKFDNKYELDIFIPSKNIGIEYNGLYWHSEINGNKDKNYHLDKTKFFEKQGIQIIHIFEDEWIEKQEIVKSIILSKLGLVQNKIFARKCQIKEITSKESKLFLFDNHIQGEINSKVNLGLFYKEELVSLMSFGKPRFNKNYDWEMTRFCNKVDFNVIGSAGKLLSYFKKTYKGTIISYADRRYSNGNLYTKLNFLKLNESLPNYYYVNHSIRYSRIQFQKHKLKDKLENFDPNLTEWQNMQLNGWDRIWDCGNLVFKL